MLIKKPFLSHFGPICQYRLRKCFNKSYGYKWFIKKVLEYPFWYFENMLKYLYLTIRILLSLYLSEISAVLYSCAMFYWIFGYWGGVEWFSHKLQSKWVNSIRLKFNCMCWQLLQFKSCGLKNHFQTTFAKLYLEKSLSKFQNTITKQHFCKTLLFKWNSNKGKWNLLKNYF